MSNNSSDDGSNGSNGDEPRNGLAQHLNWGVIPVERVSDGIERQMVVGDRMMICRFRFRPFLVTPEHDHPHEQMTLVEMGRVRFRVAGAEHEAVAGDVLLFPSGVEHGATILDEPAVLVDIFSPPREDFMMPRTAGS